MSKILAKPQLPVAFVSMLDRIEVRFLDRYPVARRARRRPFRSIADRRYWERRIEPVTVGTSKPSPSADLISHIDDD
jgi:hypothetical protein